jgi:hypothetical protein
VIETKALSDNSAPEGAFSFPEIIERELWKGGQALEP